MSVFTVGIIYNMKIYTHLDDRIKYSENSFAAIYVIEVDPSVRGSEHKFKYSLALVVDGVCVLRFDNEAGKGDHYHLEGKEYLYEFNGIQTLLADFWSNVAKLEDK